MKYLVHQTLMIEADSPDQAAQMAVEIQQSRRDWPYCNQFTVHGADGDKMIAKDVLVPLQGGPLPAPEPPVESYPDPETWQEA